MTASTATIAAISVPVGLFVLAAVYFASGRYEKPRFVVALCLVAGVIAVGELVDMLLSPADDYGHVWLGMELKGTWARVTGLIDIAIYLTGAIGLWALRPWARAGAMVYLVYLLVSFVIWGVRDAGGRGVLVVMAWQMFALPFITFSLMYLQRGAAYFGVRPSDGERKTGWLY